MAGSPASTTASAYLKTGLEIAGATRTVVIPDMWLPTPTAAFEVRRDGKLAAIPEMHTVEGHDQIRHMLENFAAAVLSGTPVSPSPDEAVKTLRVLDGLAQSARAGKVVDLA